MRWYLAPLLVLALGCGASVGASQPGQRAVFATSGRIDTLSEAQHPAVAALPVISVHRGGGTTIVVRGNVSKRRAKKVGRSAERAYRDFNQRFGVSREDDNGRRPVDICIFESSGSYRATAREVFGREAFFAVGFYMPSHRLVMVDTSRGLGNLRHEMIHPLVRDWWPEVPAWLDEGLASLYGTARPTRKGGLRFLVNYRLRHFRRAAARGKLPSLYGLANSTYEKVHGPNERAFYATSRYALLYLYRRGHLRKFVQEMRAGDLATDSQHALLKRFIDKRRFLRWAFRLRY